MPYEEYKRPEWVKPGEVWTPGQTQEQYTAGGGVLNTSTTPTNPNLTTNNVNGLNLPTGSPEVQGTNDVGGMIDYWKKQYEISQKQQADLLKQQEEQKTKQTTETQPWYKKIIGAKTPEEIRAEATITTGIKPTEYFAEQQASIAELDTLNTQYNAMVAQRDQAIADVQNRTGTTIDFSNAEQTKINRNAAVTLNQMAANINSKAAIFEMKQNRFNEAQNYINNAVNAATAEQKYNVDMYTMFYNQNQDLINSLDTKIQNALKDSQTAATNAWTTAVNEKTQVGQLMMDNPQAGILITDTLNDAMAKVARTPKAVKPDIFGSADTGYYQQVYDPITNTYKNVPVSGMGGGVGTSTNVADILQGAIDKDATPNEAARAAATVYENMGISVTQKQINDWTTQANGLKKTVIPQPTVIKPTPSMPVAASAGTSTKKVVKEILTAEPLGEWLYKGGQAVSSFWQGLFQ